MLLDAGAVNSEEIGLLSDRAMNYAGRCPRENVHGFRHNVARHTHARHVLRTGYSTDAVHSRKRDGSNMVHRNCQGLLALNVTPGIKISFPFLIQVASISRHLFPSLQGIESVGP